MNIEIDFISKPFYSTVVELENQNNLTLNWNIFKDKKDDNKLVLRIRYVLTNKDDERLSLKTLNLTQPVEFKQIYVTDDVFDEINISLKIGLTEYIINKYFGDWLKSDFIQMINSGNTKIK